MLAARVPTGYGGAVAHADSELGVNAIDLDENLKFETADKDVDAAKRFAETETETEMAAAMTRDVPLVVDAGVGENCLDAKH